MKSTVCSLSSCKSSSVISTVMPSRFQAFLALTQIELKHFEEDLRANYAISDAVEQCILIQSRKHLHPMSVLRSTVSLLGVYNVHAEEASLEATYEQSIQLMAKMPTIIAAFARLRSGQTPIEPREDLGFAANFLYMLKGQEASELEVKAFNCALVLHADHELNASTFAARVCASTLTDIYPTGARSTARRGPRSSRP